MAREAYAAWNADGAAGMEPYLADDFEFHSPPEIPGGGTFARAEALEFMTTWEAGGGGVQLQFELVEVIAIGEEFLVVLDAKQVGDSSGVELGEQRWFQLVLPRDGKITRARVFLDRDEALAAADATA